MNGSHWLDVDLFACWYSPAKTVGSITVYGEAHDANRRSWRDRQYRCPHCLFSRAGGHVVVPISRSLGVDLITGQGLDGALEGVETVVDAISSPPIGPAETRAYLGTTTRNLLDAEERAGARHHVLLSIVGIHRIEGGTPHYSGKREQERLVETGRVPWTIVPATQAGWL